MLYQLSYSRPPGDPPATGHVLRCQVPGAAGTPDTARFRPLPAGPPHPASRAAVPHQPGHPPRTAGWWRGEDSNLRRQEPADLQSAPFDRFGTSPHADSGGKRSADARKRREPCSRPLRPGRGGSCGAGRLASLPSCLCASARPWDSAWLPRPPPRSPPRSPPRPEATDRPGSRRPGRPSDTEPGRPQARTPHDPLRSPPRTTARARPPPAFRGATVVATRPAGRSRLARSAPSAAGSWRGDSNP